MQKACQGGLHISKNPRKIARTISNFEHEIEDFVKKMNYALKQHEVRFDLIKTTAPTIGKLLFSNNNSKVGTFSNTCRSTCHVCKNEARGDEKKAHSKANQESYTIDQRTSYNNSGIYLITCKCQKYFSERAFRIL